MPHTITVIFSLLLALMPGSVTATAVQFLDHEIIIVPSTGESRVTANPLEPYIAYRLRISSPHDLADILERRVDVLLNGSPLVILAHDRGLYDVINHIHTLYQGTGNPLTLKLRPNPPQGTSRLEEFKLRVPAVEVAIARQQWWENNRGLGLSPVVLQAALAVVGLAGLCYAVRQHGLGALAGFLAQIARGPRGGAGIPMPRGRRGAPGRVRVRRDNHGDIYE